MHSMVSKIVACDPTPVDRSKIVEHVASSNPPRKDYLDVLADYVSVYGGGDGAPAIKYFVNMFMRSYSACKSCG